MFRYGGMITRENGSDGQLLDGERQLQSRVVLNDLAFVDPRRLIGDLDAGDPLDRLSRFGDPL